MFALTPSPRPTFLLKYTPPHLSTKPQLFHPLLPVCCGAMGVPFDALYDIGMCTCTRLRSMTTITITITTIPLESTGCNHISRFVGFPNPRPLGLRIRVLHLSRTRHPTKYISPLPRKRKRFSFFGFFGTFPCPKKGGGVGWGRAAAAAKIRSCSSSSSSSAHQGKRDTYSYEAECVTDVPIGYILNR